MLLLSATEASQAIGAKCGGACPETDDPMLVSTLSLLTAKVETALNVESLAYRRRLDRFIVEDSCSDDMLPGLSMRLTNGFLDDSADAVVVTDSNGYTLQLDQDGALVVEKDGGTSTTTFYDGATLDIDKSLGVVSISRWRRGIYYVSYSAGFKPCDPDNLPTGTLKSSQVLHDVPDWIKLIVVAYLVKWYRSVQLAPRVNKDIAHSSVSSALDRELVGMVYGRYSRPRYGVVWGAAR